MAPPSPAMFSEITQSMKVLLSSSEATPPPFIIVALFVMVQALKVALL